ncbi:MAG: hypothetical protein WBN68_11055 [Sedimenticolaceae bacterium]
MHRPILILILFAVALTPLAFAVDKAGFDRLESGMRQQVICLDLLEGNVARERQQHATRKAFSALVASIRRYVDLGTKLGIQDLVVIRDYVGSDEVLVGVFLGAMLSDDADLQREKDLLQRERGVNLEEANRLLWKEYDCDAAFTAL